jgi:hypothetical protein
MMKWSVLKKIVRDPFVEAISEGRKCRPVDLQLVKDLGFYPLSTFFTMPQN